MKVKIDYAKLTSVIAKKHMSNSEVSKRILRGKDFIGANIRANRPLNIMLENAICDVLEVPRGTFVLSSKEKTESVVGLKTELLSIANRLIEISDELKGE